MLIQVIYSERSLPEHCVWPCGTCRSLLSKGHGLAPGSPGCSDRLCPSSPVHSSSLPAASVGQSPLMHPPLQELSRILAMKRLTRDRLEECYGSFSPRKEDGPALQSWPSCHAPKGPRQLSPFCGKGSLCLILLLLPALAKCLTHGRCLIEVCWSVECFLGFPQSSQPMWQYR